MQSLKQGSPQKSGEYQWQFCSRSEVSRQGRETEQMDKSQQKDFTGTFTFISRIWSNTFSFLAAYAWVWSFFFLTISFKQIIFVKQNQ